MTKVGDKFVLWRTEYRKNAYEDQMGIEQRGYVVLEQIVVTVSEVRNDVPCMWTDKKDYPSWKGTSQDGREFKCNWTIFPSDSFSPTYYWDVVKDEDGKFWQPVDGCQAYNKNYGVPYVTTKGVRAVPEGATLCLVHKNEAYFEGNKRGGCWKCLGGLPSTS